MSRLAKISVVAPCYNEEEGLAEFYRRTTAAVKAVCGDDYEFILIDDGSRDGTWQMLSALRESDSRIVAIKLSRNYGHQIALTAGVSLAQGQHIFVLDADLQDPPELLAPMLEELTTSGADVVYGQRKKRAGETAFKRASAHMFYRMMARISEIDIPVDTGDFRLMTKRVADTITAMPERDRFIRGMVAWVGFKQIPYMYDRDARYAGETKYPLAKMIKFALDASLGFSMAPLRLAAIGAAGLSVVLLGLIIHTLYAWLYLDTAPGWASTVMVVLVVSIIQLFSISIIGEYVGRLYLQSKARPLFLVDKVLKSD